MTYKQYVAKHGKAGNGRPLLTRQQHSELSEEGWRLEVAADIGERRENHAERVAVVEYFLCTTGRDPFLDADGNHDDRLEFRHWALGEYHGAWEGRAYPANLGYLQEFAQEFAGLPAPDLHEREIAFYAFLWHPLYLGRKTSGTWMEKAIRDAYRFYKAKGFAVAFPSGIVSKATGARERALQEAFSLKTGRRAARREELLLGPDITCGACTIR